MRVEGTPVVSQARRGAGNEGNLRRSVPAASLAALAESGLIFLPLQLLVMDAVGSSRGPLVSYPAFVALFTVSVGLATAARRWGPWAVAAGAVVVGFSQAIVWGDDGTAGVAFTIIVALLVALRVVALAYRDWRDPVGESFVVGTVVLLLEVALGTTGSDPAWLGHLPVVVALFFAGSLGSRAASVWLLAGRDRRSERDARRRATVSVALLGGIGLLLAVAARLGGADGPLRWLGGVAFSEFSRVLYGLAYVLGIVLVAPLAWILEWIHFDLDWPSEVADVLRNFGVRGRPAPDPGAEPLLRLLGFLVLVAIALLVVRAITRYRLMERTSARRLDEQEDTLVSIRPPRRLRSRRARVRRELPADTVRRWYAEALLALERRGLPKPPSRTPGEYLRTVTLAFPECAAGFTALTRGYEDVRYGNRAIDGTALDQLEADRDLAMKALRETRRRE